jgi:hypothetical protein
MRGLVAVQESPVPQGIHDGIDQFWLIKPSIQLKVAIRPQYPSKLPLSPAERHLGYGPIPAVTTPF